MARPSDFSQHERKNRCLQLTGRHVRGEIKVAFTLCARALCFGGTRTGWCYVCYLDARAIFCYFSAHFYHFASLSISAKNRSKQWGFESTIQCSKLKKSKYIFWELKDRTKIRIPIIVIPIYSFRVLRKLSFCQYFIVVFALVFFAVSSSIPLAVFCHHFVSLAVFNAMFFVGIYPKRVTV